MWHCVGQASEMVGLHRNCQPKILPVALCSHDM